MTHNLKGHILILNWSPRAAKIIEQLHAPDLGDDSRRVVVIMSDDPNLNLKEMESRFRSEQFGDRYEDVYFCPGDPCDERSLLNANVQDTKSVICLADRRSGDACDEKTLRSLMAIQSLAERMNIRLHVVLEVAKYENAQVVENLAKHFPGTIDAVTESELRTLMMAQATHVPGLIRFYSDLLSISKETNELYSVAIPKTAVGATFADYASRVILHKGRQPLIPVGIYRSGNGAPRFITNPRPELEAGKANPETKLLDGDQLLVVAWDAPQSADLPS